MRAFRLKKGSSNSCVAEKTESCRSAFKKFKSLTFPSLYILEKTLFRQYAPLPEAERMTLEAGVNIVVGNTEQKFINNFLRR